MLFTLLMSGLERRLNRLASHAVATVPNPADPAVTIPCGLVSYTPMI